VGKIKAGIARANVGRVNGREGELLRRPGGGARGEGGGEKEKRDPASGFLAFSRVLFKPKRKRLGEGITEQKEKKEKKKEGSIPPGRAAPCGSNPRILGRGRG